MKTSVRRLVLKLLIENAGIPLTIKTFVDWGSTKEDIVTHQAARSALISCTESDLGYFIRVSNNRPKTFLLLTEAALLNENELYMLSLNDDAFTLQDAVDLLPSLAKLLPKDHPLFADPKAKTEDEAEDQAASEPTSPEKNDDDFDEVCDTIKKSIGSLSDFLLGEFAKEDSVEGDSAEKPTEKPKPKAGPSSDFMKALPGIIETISSMLGGGSDDSNLKSSGKGDIHIHFNIILPFGVIYKPARKKK